MFAKLKAWISGLFKGNKMVDDVIDPADVVPLVAAAPVAAPAPVAAVPAAIVPVLNTDTLRSVLLALGYSIPVWDDAVALSKKAV